jgi:hypothetical protein
MFLTTVVDFRLFFQKFQACNCFKNSARIIILTVPVIVCSRNQFALYEIEQIDKLRIEMLNFSSSCEELMAFVAPVTQNYYYYYSMEFEIYGNVNSCSWAVR